MKPFEDTHMRLHYVSQNKDGIFIAHCIEIPSVVVYGSTKQEIEEELQKAIASYLLAFPEQRSLVMHEEVRQIEVPV